MCVAHRPTHRRTSYFMRVFVIFHFCYAAAVAIVVIRCLLLRKHASTAHTNQQPRAKSHGMNDQEQGNNKCYIRIFDSNSFDFTHPIFHEPNQIPKMHHNTHISCFLSLFPLLLLLLSILNSPITCFLFRSPSSSLGISLIFLYRFLFRSCRENSTKICIFIRLRWPGIVK